MNEWMSMNTYELCCVVLCSCATKSVSSSGTVEELWQHATHTHIKKSDLLFTFDAYTQLESTSVDTHTENGFNSR